MSAETLLWIKALHIFGIVMWVGALLGLYQIMFAYKDATTEEGRKDLLTLMSRVALVMDLGATITIGAGLGMAFSIQPSPFKVPWMHVKLTFVALFLAAHVFGRIKLKKMRTKGDTSAPAPVLFALLNLILVGMIVMAVVKPFK